MILLPLLEGGKSSYPELFISSKLHEVFSICSSCASSADIIRQTLKVLLTVTSLLSIPHSSIWGFLFPYASRDHVCRRASLLNLSSSSSDNGNFTFSVSLAYTPISRPKRKRPLLILNWWCGHHHFFRRFATGNPVILAIRNLRTSEMWRGRGALRRCGCCVSWFLSWLISCLTLRVGCVQGPSTGPTS